MGEFERIFGCDTVNGEKCLVYNDTQAGCPMLIINSAPIRIRLAQSSLSCWSQTIFQLSHELCHYALRQHKAQKELTLSWIEEIMCEAVSLYALKYCAINWNQCGLNTRNPDYFKSIFEYLDNELNKSGTTGLKDCKTPELLSQYETIADTDRESHRNECILLYQEISKNPTDCLVFCKYQKYINSNGITIDFDTWENEDSSQLVRVLHKLQPCT